MLPLSVFSQINNTSFTPEKPPLDCFQKDWGDNQVKYWLKMKQPMTAGPSSSRPPQFMEMWEQNKIVKDESSPSTVPRKSPEQPVLRLGLNLDI